MWEWSDGTNYLEHHGIIGQKWGVRRYQNKDGSLTRAGKAHLARMEKKDLHWVKKNAQKIYKKTYKKVQAEDKQYYNDYLKKKYAGQIYTSRKKLNANLVNEYNRNLAQLMNKAVGDIPAPSGRVIRYVAKRGEIGVHAALADSGYDMSQVKNGVWNSGRVAYKKDSVKTAAV